MKEIKYKGKGEHNVYQLEAIIEEREERIHQLCVKDAGLLAEIRNKMGGVAYLVSMVELTQYPEGSNEKNYGVVYLAKALERAKESLDWLRDDNNF